MYCSDAFLYASWMEAKISINSYVNMVTWHHILLYGNVNQGYLGKIFLLANIQHLGVLK